MAKRKVKIEQPEIVQQVAKRLRGLREARNLTRAKLVDMASVGLSHLGRLEREKASPGVDLLDHLAKSLGVTVNDLLPPAETQETLTVLLERAKQLLDKVDRETLLFLNPLLARLAQCACWSVIPIGPDLPACNSDVSFPQADSATRLSIGPTYNISLSA
jgi:transcriptional regulator with XRE-family HTH domain